MTKIFAHRGASGYKPENTMESFRLAYELGADGIEFDVHLTKDGVPVIIHDEKIDRTSSGTGYVKDFTFEELGAFDFCGEFKSEKKFAIPTLKMVLEFASGNDLILNIELKTDVFTYPGIEKNVLKLVYDLGLEKRVIISSFNPISVKMVRERCPEIKKNGIDHRDTGRDRYTYGRADRC